MVREMRRRLDSAAIRRDASDEHNRRRPVAAVEALPATARRVIVPVHSPKDLHAIARQVAAELPAGAEHGALIAPALEDFLRAQWTRPEVLALAIVDHRERVSRPALDFYLLWRWRLHWDADGQTMRDITTEHVYLMRALAPALKSFLSIVDTQQYLSPERLAEYLTTVERAGTSALLRCCLRFQR